MDSQMIEYLHDTGKMSDKVYYQVNGKSFQENYIDILRRRSRRDYRDNSSRAQQEERELEERIDQLAERAVEKALDKLFK